METVIRNVADLDRGDRSVMERVVGHTLGEKQRLIIQVTNLESPTSAECPAVMSPDLPDWCDVYAGLSDAEIDDLDAAIRERANLSRSAGPACTSHFSTP